MFECPFVYLFLGCMILRTDDCIFVKISKVSGQVTCDVIKMLNYPFLFLRGFLFQFSSHLSNFYDVPWLIFESVCTLTYPASTIQVTFSACLSTMVRRRFNLNFLMDVVIFVYFWQNVLLVCIRLRKV